MRRIICATVFGLILLAQGGCVAVSAKEVNSQMRYEAVAANDGRIYVVDKKKLTARLVRVVNSCDVTEP